MATDALLERRGKLAAIDNETVHRLNEILPAAWSRGNPIDILGDASPERLGSALQLVLSDRNVDAALVVLSPQAMTNPTECAQAVAATAKSFQKPILTSWMGGVSMQAGIEKLNEVSIPTYATPERAVRSFMHYVTYRRLHEHLYETPEDVDLAACVNHARVKDLLKLVTNDQRMILKENEAKELLEAYGIPVAKVIVASHENEAIQVARQVGYPVAMKLVSADITHKTDVGGVELHLSTDEAVATAFIRIQNRLAQLRPDARFEGVTIQPMISEAGGRELIVGAMRDPVFGMVMLVGAGGVDSELIHDRTLELPPLNAVMARRMVERLRIWPLLQGYRGRSGIDISQLIDVLLKVSHLVVNNPEIAELDINPLLVTPNRSIALDARVILSQKTLDHVSKRYSHLSIRPYPAEFMKQIALKDQSPIRLRPIKPEDEPMWGELINNCSVETLHSRFGCLFNTHSHEMASRFCFVDYDRELAIVAEVQDHQQRRSLAGVGRLVADADHQNAEFALLVGDPWQGKGLGSLLTAYCLEICRDWGIRRLSAETSPSNYRMLHVFERNGFQVEYREDVVVARKEIAKK